MKVLFLSAGEGLRFRDLVGNDKDMPKTLYELYPGITILDIIIDYFSRSGFVYQDMIICGLRKHEKFYERFEKKGITLSLEEKPSGTAGAVYNARDNLDGPFIVRNGDTIHIDLELKKMLEIFQKNPNNAILSAVRRRLPSGYIKIKGNRVVGFEEKPLSPYHEYSGTAIFPNLDYFLPNGFIEIDVFPIYARLGRLLCVISAPEGYFPIDTLKDAENARKSLSKYSRM